MQNITATVAECYMDDNENKKTKQNEVENKEKMRKIKRWARPEIHFGIVILDYKKYLHKYLQRKFIRWRKKC